MTDAWTFRTDTGRATVADGQLRISESVRGLLGKRWREGWVRSGPSRRLLFVASLVGTAMAISGVVRKMLAGRMDSVSVFFVAALCFVVVTVTYRTNRTQTVPLRAITEAQRVDPDRLRVEYDDGERDALDVTTPTEREADEAVEILRLRGIPIEDRTDADGRASSGFRRRLRAK